MPNRKNERREEYARYAEHCLDMARIAPDRKSRVIQREMAAEWLRLAAQVGAEDRVASADRTGQADGQSKYAS